MMGHCFSNCCPGLLDEDSEHQVQSYENESDIGTVELSVLVVDATLKTQPGLDVYKNGGSSNSSLTSNDKLSKAVGGSSDSNGRLSPCSPCAPCDGAAGPGLHSKGRKNHQETRRKIGKKLATHTGMNAESPLNYRCFGLKIPSGWQLSPNLPPYGSTSRIEAYYNPSRRLPCQPCSKLKCSTSAFCLRKND